MGRGKKKNHCRNTTYCRNTRYLEIYSKKYKAAMRAINECGGLRENCTNVGKCKFRGNPAFKLQVRQDVLIKSLASIYSDLQAFQQNEKKAQNTHLLEEKDQKLKGSEESKYLFTCRNSEGLLERGRNEYAHNIHVPFQHVIQRALTIGKDS